MNYLGVAFLFLAKAMFLLLPSVPTPSLGLETFGYVLTVVVVALGAFVALSADTVPVVAFVLSAACTVV